jgi:hypothetical protein
MKNFAILRTLLIVRFKKLLYLVNLGKALIQRRGEIASEKQVDPESNAVSRILNMEVRAQLPADTSNALLWKPWKLFDVIGMDKIYRIHHFSFQK